jgi:hypothetical protein
MKRLTEKEIKVMKLNELNDEILMLYALIDVCFIFQTLKAERSLAMTNIRTMLRNRITFLRVKGEENEKTN